MIERMGLAARAIARRRAETALIADLDAEKLQTLDELLKVDPAIGQTRFHWLRSAPDAPGAGNLVGLTERIAFLRALEIDPHCRRGSRPDDGIRWSGRAMPRRHGSPTTSTLAAGTR